MHQETSQPLKPMPATNLDASTRRRWVLPSVVVVALLVLVGAAGFWMLRHRTRSDDVQPSPSPSAKLLPDPRLTYAGPFLNIHPDECSRRGRHRSGVDPEEVWRTAMAMAARRRIASGGAASRIQPRRPTRGEQPRQRKEGPIAFWSRHRDSWLASASVVGSSLGACEVRSIYQSPRTAV